MTGSLKPVGIDELEIYDEVSRLLNDKDENERMSKASDFYGEGKSFGRITDILAYEITEG